jgi:hypothetical protein
MKKVKKLDGGISSVVPSQVSDPYPVTLKKKQVKDVIDLFIGTKKVAKTPIGKIAEILNIDRKQVLRVLHKNNLKTYSESSLK